MFEHLIPKPEPRLFRYWLTHRPPHVGCMPDGYTRTMVYERLNLVAGQHDSQIHALGYADYPSPLSPQQCYDYELVPANAQERQTFFDWKNQPKETRK